MEIKITPAAITTDTHWYSKGYGVVLVEQAEHIDKVLAILSAQDDYWEGMQKLIKVAPQETKSRNELMQQLADYAHKTDIYDIPNFINNCKEQGINVMILSDYSNSVFL